LNRGLAPEGEILFFAPPKKSIQKKGGPVAAYFLRSSLSPGVAGRAIPGPPATRGFLPRPCGLLPAKAPVLGAANGIEFVPPAGFLRSNSTIARFRALRIFIRKQRRSAGFACACRRSLHSKAITRSFFLVPTHCVGMPYGTRCVLYL